MGKFEILLSYSKIIEAYDEDAAQSIIDSIESKSNLTDEYGPFDSLDSWTEVRKIEDE